MNAIGIDIGGTSIKIAIRATDGAWLQFQTEPYNAPTLADLQDRLTSIAPFAPAANVGLCAPGAFDPATSRIIASANVPALVNVNLSEWLERATGTRPARLHIDTDVFATATDLWHTRPRPQLDPLRPYRLCVIALGTGVGMSILDNGQRLALNGLSSGHLGQIDVSLEDRPVPVGPDGGRGGLEAYIGLPALTREFGPDLPAAVPHMNSRTPALRALAKAIRIVHAIYRPDEIILAGGVALALAPHTVLLTAMVQDGLTSLARPHCAIDFAPDTFCAARGIARLAAT